MKDLSFKNFIEQSDLKIQSAIELGGGEGNDANWLCGKGVKEIIMIDKKSPEGSLNNGLKFVRRDFFNTDETKGELDDKEFDLLFSCYSICFNTRQQIEEKLPFYLEKIKKGGTFYLLDFNPNEQVVARRTNLWDGWFFSLLNKYFNHFEIKTQEVYEKAHQHRHNIFELVCSNRIL